MGCPDAGRLRGWLRHSNVVPSLNVVPAFIEVPNSNVVPMSNVVPTSSVVPTSNAVPTQEGFLCNRHLIYVESDVSDFRIQEDLH